MAYKFFDKKSTDNGVNFVSNQQHPNELYKPFIRKVKRRRRAYSSFKETFWA